MGPVWTNSFETPAEWTLDDMAQIVENATLARTGSRFLVLKSAYALGGAVDRQSAAIRGGITLVNGENVEVSFYAWMLLATGQKADLIVDFDKGDGSFVEIGRITPGASELVYTLRTFPVFVALGTTGRIRLRTSDLSADGNTIWYIDDARVEPMAETISIRDDIVSDLADITTGNGYSATVANVFTLPTPIQNRTSPSIQLTSGAGGIGSESGSSDPETLSDRIGNTVQQFNFELYIEAADPITSALNLLDDVRNVIERTSGGNVNSSGRIVTVTEWSHVLTSEDINQNHGIVTGTIAVDYNYTRGSV